MRQKNLITSTLSYANGPIEIVDLSKTYRSGGKTVQALDNVTLTIEQKDVYGIIGLSGAGKSTLIRCIASLLRPSSGKILFNGNDLNQMNKNQLRQFRLQIGMIFQHFNLLTSRTVADNIAYPLEIAAVSREEQEQRVGELLELVGLSAKKHAYPALLSGGEKQRVGIGRALANHPDILLCDEATSALDPKTTRDILSLLRSINTKLGLTIVLITHEMEVVKQICNKVAVIENGRIVEAGPVSTVFADPQHSTTKQFLQTASHEIPPEFLKPISPNRKLLRLRFKGQVLSEPIISEIVKKFDVSANILLSWIDRLPMLSIGTLVIELTGSPQGISDALNYFSEKTVHYEVIESGL
jgi:D-methionine transport system ATP-binding protein